MAITLSVHAEALEASTGVFSIKRLKVKALVLEPCENAAGSESAGESTFLGQLQMVHPDGFNKQP
jgi:hypothetical protein